MEADDLAAMRAPRFLVYTAIVFSTSVLLAGIIVPLWNVLGQSWGAAVSPDDSVWQKSILWATLTQAGWSTGLSALGIPLGVLLGTALRAQSRAAKWVASIFAMTFSVPTVVVASAWVIWLGKSGVLGHVLGSWAYSLKAVILAHVFLNLPWVALRVAQARADAHVLYEETAAVLGASMMQRWRYVIWPQIRVATLLVMIQVFQMCITSFGIVLILGGGPPVQTLETEIYSKIRYSGLDFSGASRYALLQILLTFPLGLASYWIEKKWRVSQLFFSQRSGAPTSNGRHVFLILAAFFLICPYLILFRSLISLHWMEIAPEILAPLWTSLQIAGISSALVLLIAGAVLMSLKNLPHSLAWIWDGLSQLPAALSVLVLSLGFWLSYQKWLDPFEGSLAGMVIVQSVVFLPLALRYLKPLLGGVRARELEAAATLGAPPLRMWWWVEWPRWRRPVWMIALMIFSVSLGEVAAVSLFYSENLLTLPIVVMRWMSQYRFDEAQGLSFLLFVIAAGVSLLSLKVGESFK